MIPAIGSCRFDTNGERRLAERLEQKLDEDYLLWYNVPVGPKQSYPDFVVIHPRRGALILETKDWHLDTIKSATPQRIDLLVNGEPKTVMNPVQQARHCAIQVVNSLERDSQLVHADGPFRGKLAFPWGHGVVFTRITRKQFTEAHLDQAMPPHLVICQDEMVEAVDAEEFQQRLWDMFPHAFGRGVLTLPQLDRVRWIMFPQVRVSTQAGLFDGNESDLENDQLPDIMRVMDLQQEQLARSLGDGHRVIHGVAGSGKTMILGYRAEHLAQAATSAKPILVLCYNEPLAVKLNAMFVAKGLADRIHARNFHKWCRQQLVAFGQPLPRGTGNAFFEEMVENVIRGVERQQIPSGQYLAVLIDEGHDFQPEWFKLVTQMVDPSSNSLLVLYDSVQNIYGRTRKGLKFSLKSVGINAVGRGRSVVLQVNYRNTRQIMKVAHDIAHNLFGEPVTDDQEGGVSPISCGREGPAPILIKLPTVREQAFKIADVFDDAHREGHAWGDMAMLCRNHADMNTCAAALAALRLPHQVRRKSGDFEPFADTIKVMTMYASKGLEFPVVAIVGASKLSENEDDAREEARLLYVAATRATSRLVVGGDHLAGR